LENTLATQHAFVYISTIFQSALTKSGLSREHRGQWTHNL